MQVRKLADAAMALGVVLTLGIPGSNGRPVVFNLAQPRPVSAATLPAATLARVADNGCAGDCNSDGQVAIDEILQLVAAALTDAPLDTCAGADGDHNQQITVDEIVLAVHHALNGCPAPPRPTATPTTVPTPTRTPGGPLPVAEAVARYGNGVAIHRNETVTTEGVVTVSPGVLANNKLKIFLQDGGAGIEVYDQASAHVPPGDFEEAQRCRVTGVVRQADPAGDNVLTGTVMVDVSGGSWSVLSGGNPLPAPQMATLHNLTVNGVPYVGVLVQVAHVQKVSGNWPVFGDKTTTALISDDGGTNQLPLRFQRNTITLEMAAKLKSIGNGPFSVVGIAVQNAVNLDLLKNFEIWVRGVDDIIAP